MQEISQKMVELQALSRGRPIWQQDAENALLENIGIRIRRARVARKLSRRALSEQCGISQRYLAQLESGNGNVSILLLHRVASALDERIDQLIRGDSQTDTGYSELATLFEKADSDKQLQVLKVLKQQDENAAPVRRLAFIGLRGAGKSTLGKLTAEKSDLPFLELNSEIEKVSGIPVHEVMALYGNDGYRRLEIQSLRRLVDERQGFVLAVAGGIVMERETFRILLQSCFTIWLKAQPEEHMARVRGQGDERPMAGNPDAMRQLRKILSTRERSYGKADLTVSTSGKSVNACLDEILAGLEKAGKQKKTPENPGPE